jgi:crossover junction endodeoxyribonuclease RuvC
MDRLVLAIDPGPNKAGFAALKVKERPEIVESAQVDLGKEDSLEIRLDRLYQETLAWIDRHHPSVLAVESWCKPYDQKWMAQELAAEARAVVRLAALHRGIPIVDYNPNVVKERIAGASKASKDQVRRAVMIALRLDWVPKEDQGDAIAVGLAYCQAHYEEAI